MFYTIFKILRLIVSFLITLPRDLRGLLMLTKLKKKSENYDRTNNNVADVFTEWVRKQPNKPCIIFKEQTWTFKDVKI